MGLPAESMSEETIIQSSFKFLEDLLADYPRRDFQVRLWERSSWRTCQSPRFTLVLQHPGALNAMFASPSELTLGEAYIFGDFDIEGDIEAALDLADSLLAQNRSLTKRLHLAGLLRSLPATKQGHRGRQPASLQGPLHSESRDRQAISYHYDLPADFYAVWLDKSMVYSCGYFTTPEDDLETAQRRKLDYLCRKLRLGRGDYLLDIGCGWGALIMHAAAHYGVQALGVTLSTPQARLARQRIEQAGLQDQCRVEVRDYRDLDSSQPYDKIVSVGMFEHVGGATLPEYFTRAWNLLRPGGVFLNHGIAYSATYQRHGPSFTDRYVFPDGELVPISASLRAAEVSRFEVRDVESLREHYVLTLRHWIKRLEAHAEEARRITDESTYRTCRLYMAGSAHSFCTGRLNVYQVLLAKPLHGQSGLPLTRAEWYRD